MATQVQNRRGTTAEHSTFTGANGELTVDTTKRTLVVHDGATAGGRPLLREDQSNLPTSAPTTGIYNSSGALVLSTNGTKRIEIQADGDIDIDGGGVFYDATNNRLAIGTTSPGSELEVSSADNTGITIRSGAITGYGNINFTDGAVKGQILYDHNGDYMRFYVNGGEAARIDSSGRLLVGTSSSVSVASLESNQQIFGSAPQLSITRGSNNASGATLALAKSRNTAYGSRTIVADGDTLGSIRFCGDDGVDLDSIGAQIAAQVDGTPGSNDLPSRLVFSVTADGASSPTERMRINNAGTASHGVDSGFSSLVLSNGSAAGITDALVIGRYGSNVPGSGTISFVVRTNGNVENLNNSYGAYSDIKLKENIVDANPQWDDIKALQVRNYNFKEGQTHTQIGLIAQEVELVSPGLVSESPDLDEDGNDLGTVTKSVNYSVLYMKAVKALQEAMERIETLEAKVAALESA